MNRKHIITTVYVPEPEQREGKHYITMNLVGLCSIIVGIGVVLLLAR